MPEFASPEPITAIVEVVAGSVRLTADDREDTVVEIRPCDSSRSSDVRAAEQARIDFHNNTLKVSAGPKFVALGRGGAVDIDIALPSRSRLHMSSASADIYTAGILADSRFSSASGDLELDGIEGRIKADTASGDVAVRRLTGNALFATASGNARICHLDGGLKFQTASGELSIERLQGNAQAQTASGSVAITSAVNGSVVGATSSGEVEVGIPAGTAARLDLATSSGAVLNSLTPTDSRPTDAEETLTVHVRTSSGDISVQRAADRAHRDSTATT